MNSRLTLYMTLHIKGENNLKIITWKPKEITQKFDVLNQYHTLALIDQTISRKIVATIEKTFDEICLKNMYL